MEENNILSKRILLISKSYSYLFLLPLGISINTSKVVILSAAILLFFFVLLFAKLSKPSVFTIINCSFRLLRFRPIAEINQVFLEPKLGHYSGVNLKIVGTGPF